MVMVIVIVVNVKVNVRVNVKVIVVVIVGIRVSLKKHKRAARSGTPPLVRAGADWCGFKAIGACNFR